MKCIHILKHVKYAHTIKWAHSFWQAVLDQDLLFLVQLGNQVLLEKLCRMEAFKQGVGCPSPWPPPPHTLNKTQPYVKDWIDDHSLFDAEFEAWLITQCL